MRNNRVYNTLDKYLKNKSSKIIIPPKKNATASNKSHPQRGGSIRSRKRYEKPPWIIKSKYNLRNRAGNTFLRYKRIIGPSLNARTLQGQRVELQMSCKILNIMTGLGMPQSSLKIQHFVKLGIFYLKFFSVLHQSRVVHERKITNIGL